MNEEALLPIWDPSRCPRHRAGQPRADLRWNRGRTSGVPCARTAAALPASSYLAGRAKVLAPTITVANRVTILDSIRQI